MDRRLKERLIGATILVVLIVLIVPELLSGPKGLPSAQKSAAVPLDSGTADTVRNVTVDLATKMATSGAEDAASGAPASAAVASPSGAAAPAPDDGSPDDGQTDTPSGNETNEPAPPDGARKASPALSTLAAQRARPGAVENDAAGLKTDVSRHTWAVQVGSFANKANADKLVRHLRLQFPSVGLSASGSGPSLRYRVRVTSLPDRKAAVQALGTLKAQKYQAGLVAPSP